MRVAALHVGGSPLLRAWVVETDEEQRRGLQGFSGLTDGQAMYFPREPPGGMRISMMGVGFPIDVIFFRDARVSSVHVGRPGDLSVWGYGECSGVLEVRHGWARDHDVRMGDLLIAAL